jgi:serine phosphatase RsbU (regulator of sigma subunit)
MGKKIIPTYYGFRIYLTSVMLYFFLVIPFIGFIVYQNIPSFIKNNPNAQLNQAMAIRDSVTAALDSSRVITDQEIDSLVNIALEMSGVVPDSIPAAEEDIIIGTPPPENHGRISINKTVEDESPAPDENRTRVFTEKGPFARYFLLLFILLLVSDVVGYIYNRPFKRYFKLKLRGGEIPDKLHRRCKKSLFQTPLVNSLIVTMPNIVVLLYSLIFLISKGSFDEELERSMFIQLHYLTIVATALEFLFVYYWQKHRVHIRYIDQIFSDEELRKRVSTTKGGKIRNRLMVASGITTFLPLLIVMVYLFLSLTAVRDLKQESFTREQREILIGPWSEIANSDQVEVQADKYDKLFYVNAIDSIMMLVGIGNGILVSFIYLLLFVRWTNQDITRPVKELLTNIRNTRGGDKEQFTLVRSDDEIGELAEGYNEMTQKIHNYVESISSMNRDLEEKVRERTREVVEQKEEIETQKEEIEAQLDLATLQRDTISDQKELILDSIHYAERIQAAILPPVHVLEEHISEHFILYKPRDIVSGDYYWAREKDQKLLVAVADCTGHGVPGGFLSMLGISSMNEIVNRSKELNPGRILEQLREIVITSLHQTGTRDEAQDGIEIALCVIDLKQKSMKYAGANRPLYLVRNGIVENIRPDRMPIGIYEQETVPFSDHSIKLQRGDSIYLFSDGYVDQLGGPHRKTFRVINFRKLLLEIQDRPMEKQKAILEERLAAWQGEVEQIDDILVLGFRI